MSSEACPRTLRYICACLQRDVQNRCGNIKNTCISFPVCRWPQERLVKTRVVSGFIFLRLLCPAILNPRQVLEEKFSLFNRTLWIFPAWPPLFLFARKHSEYMYNFQFGLLSEPVPPPAMRSLVMIAKCLQVKQLFAEKKIVSPRIRAESC